MRYPPEGMSDWTVRERITTKNTENFGKRKTQRKQTNELQGIGTEVERETTIVSTNGSNRKKMDR
jgi:hypothetical protein